MILTIQSIFDNLIWKKEQVAIRLNEKISDIKRLEFHYEAIENNYEVDFIESCYDKEKDICYLIIWCEDGEENE